MVFVPSEILVAFLIVVPQVKVLSIFCMCFYSGTKRCSDTVVEFNFVIFEFFRYGSITRVSDHSAFRVERCQTVLLIYVLWFWLCELRKDVWKVVVWSTNYGNVLLYHISAL